MNFTHGGNVFAIARACGVPPEEFLDFSASINPLGPALGVREAVTAAFDRIGHYPDTDCTELRQALARLHGVEPANLCVGNGSTELIYLLPRLVAGGRRRALVVAPPFSEYAAALGRDGWETAYFDLTPATGFDLPLERLAAELAKGYDLVILANPGNPTGRLYDVGTVAALAERCGAVGSFLVVDEAFMDFCEESSIKRLVAGAEHLLVLRSLTKFYALPGLRLGFAVGSSPVIERLARLREPWSVNILAQAAGVASLAADGYAAATLRLVATERQRLFAGLAAITGLRPFPSSTNYLLMETTAEATAAEISQRLLVERILIRDCGNFRGLTERFFRVAVRSPQENDRLLAALAEVMG
jgi:threonine-phosphate decarboxylase